MANVLPNLQGLASVNAAEVNTVPTTCVLDTVNSIGLDANTSNTATWPSAFQVDPIPVGTQVKVQVRLHKDAAWITLWDSEVDAAPVDRAYIQTWQTSYNFMRAIRVSGTGEVKAFASMYAPDNQG